MNAKEQYKYYAQQFIRTGILASAMRDERMVSPALFNMHEVGFSLRLLSDLRLKLQAYGDKAFPLSEAQEKAVADGLDKLRNEVQIDWVSIVQKWEDKSFPFDAIIDDYCMAVAGTRRVYEAELDWLEKAIEAHSERPDHVDLDALPEYVSAAEIAKIYRLASATVRQAINRNTLPARKSGGVWMVRVADADKRWGASAWDNDEYIPAPTN